MKQYHADSILDALKGSEGERNAALRFIYKESMMKQTVVQWICRNGGSKEEAEECFQDALVIFDRNVRNGKFSDHGSWQAYLFGITRYCWLERLRRRKPASLELLSIHLNGLAEHSFEKQVIEEERTGLLKQAIETLRGRCKQILILYKSGVSHEEIAQEMGFSNSEAAKKECYRCRLRFRKFLMQRPGLLKLIKDSFGND